MGYSIPVVPNLPGVPSLSQITSRAIGSATTALLNESLGDFVSPTFISSTVATLTTQFNSVVGNLTSGLLSSRVGQEITSVLSGNIGVSLAASLDETVPDGSPPLTADAPDVQAGASTATWGLYDADNNPVIIADSTVSLDYSKDYSVPKYPMEGGAFQSYNKVEAPYEVRIRFTRGGSDADRGDFFLSIEDALSSLDLCSVVMPEYTYLNGNPTHVDWSRKAEQGMTLITAEIHVEQIRESATVAFSSTQSPSAAGQVDAGAVQPQPPTAAQSAASKGGAG